MFEHTSRYATVETAVFVGPHGKKSEYKRRRFVPRSESLPLLTAATVAEGERLDLVTARTLGDPEQFWRISDANDALNPFELTRRPGRVLRIPRPQV